MGGSDSHKALALTFMVSLLVVVLSFNLHLKQKSLVAETYFQIIPEEEVEPEPEDLEQILKSFEELETTNRAVNQDLDRSDFEDEDFQNTMDKIKNRDVAQNNNDLNQENKSGSSDANEDDLKSFESINKVIEERSNSNSGENSDLANKASTVSFSLVGRSSLYLPPPIYLCEAGGKIVVSITVNAEGRVTDASYNNSSSSQNGCLIDHALEYAREAIFSADAKGSQIGTITFYFKGKN